MLIDGHWCMAKFRDVFFFYFLLRTEEHHECLFKLIATDADINQFKESICKKTVENTSEGLRVREAARKVSS